MAELKALGAHRCFKTNHLLSLNSSRIPELEGLPAAPALPVSERTVVSQLLGCSLTMAIHPLIATDHQASKSLLIDYIPIAIAGKIVRNTSLGVGQ